MPDVRKTIRITTTGAGAMVAEARDKLDRWLAKLGVPPSGQAQALRLIEVHGNSITYELSLRAHIPGEPRTIL